MESMIISIVQTFIELSASLVLGLMVSFYRT